MGISLRITESVDVIEKEINKGIANYVNQKLSTNQNRIVGSIKSLVPSWILAQPEMVALASKDPISLAGYFGIAGDSSSIATTIAVSIADSLTFKFDSFNNNLNGGFEVYIQPTTFINLLGLKEGHSVYSGGNLHWLDWLLTKGDEIIISNYQYNPKTGFGRSGLGNMIPGGVFRVPPQYSGTIKDNFVTRALTGNEQDKAITQIFDNYLG
jgi:hypothetical protein